MFARRRAGSHRSAARFLAPIALAATIAGTYIIVHHALQSPKHHTAAGGGGGGGGGAATTSKSSKHGGHSSRKPRFYTVKAGDSLTGIASRTGIALGTLQALNPKVNPNALQPGQRLRLQR